MAYSTNVVHSIKIGNTTYQVQDTESNTRLGVLEGGADVNGSVAKAVSDSQSTLIGNATNDTAASNTINGAKKYADSLATNYDAAGTASSAAAAAKSEVIGTSSDTTTADTINGAKAYAKNLVDNILGEDSASTTLSSLKAVIQELNDPANANGITGTFVDSVKSDLAGLTKTVNDEEQHATVKEYVDNAVAAGISGQNTSSVSEGVLSLGR